MKNCTLYLQISWCKKCIGSDGEVYGSNKLNDSPCMQQS